MQKFLNVMMFCLLVQWQGVLGNEVDHVTTAERWNLMDSEMHPVRARISVACNSVYLYEGCDKGMWPLIPKFLTDLIVQVLLRSTVIIVYEDSQKDYVTQVVAELHRNSLNPVVQSVAMDSSYNRNSSSKDLLHLLNTLTFNQSTLIYAVCVCFTSSVLELFLRFPVVQRHLTGKIPEAEVANLYWKPAFLALTTVLGIEGDFSANERWIFLGPYFNKSIFSNFTYKVAVANIKKTQEISISGSHFLPDVNRRSRLLAKWNISGFEAPDSAGLMDATDKYSLKDKRVRVAHLDVFPFFTQEQINPELFSKGYQMIGMEYQLISAIAEYYGFRFQCVPTRDKKWGHMENNTWFGLVGMVHRQKADVAMTSFSQTFERLSAIDYSYPHYLDPVAFVTKSPKMRSRAFLIFKPFQISVTASVLLAAFVTGCLLHVSSKISSSVQGKRSKWGLFSSLWFIFGSLTLRGDGFKKSREPTIRVLISFWWLFTLVIMSAFAGVLVSCLNVPKLEDAINSIEQLHVAINNKQLLPSTLRSTSIFTNFQNAKEGVLFTIGQKLKQDPELAPENLRSGLELTLHRQAALIFPRVMTEGTAVTLGRDRFHFSDESFFIAMYSIGMPKRSPLKSLFSPVIRKLTESGIISRWLYLTLLKKRVMSETHLNSTTEESKRLTWEEMKGTFLILGTGYVLSLIAFAVEKLLHCKNRKIANMTGPADMETRGFRSLW